MKNETIHYKVLNAIQQKGKGSLIFPGDYIELGNNNTIRQVFSRFAKDQTLERLAPGIYLYPEMDKEFGIAYPSTENIAEAIAKRDKARIIPTGIQALYKLGLSTQVPMNIVYLTDGAPRKIKLGKNAITFKLTAPRKFEFKGKLSTLVIQAMKELGKEGVTQQVKQRLEEVLKNEDWETLSQDAKNAPVWISKFLFNILTRKNHDRMVTNISRKKEERTRHSKQE
jgi:Family of unknown function (DUF6088)